MIIKLEKAQNQINYKIIIKDIKNILKDNKLFLLTYKEKNKIKKYKTQFLEKCFSISKDKMEYYIYGLTPYLKINKYYGLILFENENKIKGYRIFTKRKKDAYL